MSHCSLRRRSCRGCTQRGPAAAASRWRPCRRPPPPASLPPPISPPRPPPPSRTPAPTPLSPRGTRWAARPPPRPHKRGSDQVGGQPHMERPAARRRGRADGGGGTNAPAGSRRRARPPAVATATDTATDQTPQPVEKQDRRPLVRRRRHGQRVPPGARRISKAARDIPARLARRAVGLRGCDKVKGAAAGTLSTAADAAGASAQSFVADTVPPTVQTDANAGSTADYGQAPGRGNVPAHPNIFRNGTSALLGWWPRPCGWNFLWLPSQRACPLNRKEPRLQTIPPRAPPTCPALRGAARSPAVGCFPLSKDPPRPLPPSCPPTPPSPRHRLALRLATEDVHDGPTFVGTLAFKSRSHTRPSSRQAPPQAPHSAEGPRMSGHPGRASAAGRHTLGHSTCPQDHPRHRRRAASPSLSRSLSPSRSPQPLALPLPSGSPRTCPPSRRAPPLVARSAGGPRTAGRPGRAWAG